MKIKIPGGTGEFEIPDEWWRSAGMEDFVPRTAYYNTDLSACSEILLVEEVEPPLREKCEFWFRNRETVIEVLEKIRSGEKLDPIEVWSREKSNSKKFKVRDGFHRFYLSIAAGYSKLPVKINDFDLNEFLEKESRGKRRLL